MNSVSTGANAALGGAGSGQIVMWFFQCWSAGHMVVPSMEAAMMMGALAIPIVHITYKIMTATLERWTGIDLNGNGDIGNSHSETKLAAL
jgi:hypothetical protein